MNSNNSIVPVNFEPYNLVTQSLIQNGQMVLLILALLLFAFSLFVFHYHLSRFSVNKLYSLRAELFYIIGSVIIFIFMAISLFKS